MYELINSNKFKKDLSNKVNDPKFPLTELKQITKDIVNQKELNIKYRNHKLSGEWDGCFEFHLRPDILVIYKIDKMRNIVYFIRIGSHSELF